MIARDEEDYDRELLEMAWRFLAEHDAALRRECEWARRGSSASVAELMSEVVARLPDMLLNYKPNRGASVKTHVLTSVKWYLSKLVRGDVTHGPQLERSRRAKHELALLAAAGPTLVAKSGAVLSGLKRCAAFSELEDADEVQCLLEGLHPLYRAVLQLRYMTGATYDDIASAVGASKSAVKALCDRALEEVKEAARRRSMQVKCLVCGSAVRTADDAEIRDMVDVVCEECGLRTRIVAVPMNLEEPKRRDPPLAFATYGRRPA